MTFPHIFANLPAGPVPGAYLDDNFNSFASSSGASLVSFTQAGTGAVSRDLQSKERETVSVTDFMTAAQIADVIAGTLSLDVTAAIQSAIDYCLYTTGAPKRLKGPYGKYKTSDVIHVGYGVGGYTSIIIEFESAFNADQTTKISGIFPTFNDRPAINIQGGRKVRIKNLAIQGVNWDWLEVNYSSIADRSVLANWYGPNISAANNTRYAPYAGITVDAYSGTLPGTPYPTVTYPAFLGGGIAQYNKNFSSNVILENVTVGGFVVGVAVQPGIVPNGSNGDFVTLKDCDISFNLVNYADGHVDARNPNFYNSRLTHAHTVIDSLTYGNQGGSLAINADGCGFDSVFRILNINIGGDATQGVYAAGFRGCYGEDMLSIGNAYTAGIDVTPTGVSFTETKFVFAVKNSEFSPVYLYNAPGTDLYLRNVSLNGQYGFHQLNANVTIDGLSIDKLQADVSSPASGTAYKVGKSYLSGIFAPKAYRARVIPIEFYTLFPTNYPGTRLDSESFPVDFEAGVAGGTAAGVTIPWFINQMSYGGSRFPISNVNPLVLNRVTYNLSSVSLSGIEYTFTSNNAFITDALGANTDAPFSVGKGDAVVDSISGQVFFVTTVSFSGTGPGTTMTATIRQLNNVRNTGGSTYVAGGSLSSNTGTLTFYNARRVYPSATRLNFTATAASGSIVHKICGDEANVNFMCQPIATGDYLISSQLSQSALDSVFPKFSKVTAVNINTGAVTVNQNARRSYYGETPLYVKVL